MIRQEGNLPPHFAVSTNQPRIQYYPRPQEQMGVAAHPTNIQYARIQPVVQQQRTQVAATTADQRVPIMLRPRYPAAVQPHFQYGANQVNVRPGVHYSGVDMYPNYSADMKLSTFSQYQAEMPAYGTNPFPIHQQNGVPTHHVQFGYTQAPLEYPLDANDYNDNMSFQGIIKKEPVDGETAVDGGVIKRCKRPRKVKTSDISGEAVDADGVPIRKKRTNKRRKLISGSEGAEPSLADTNVVTADQPHALTHGELLKQKKKNMAFPKGTFLVRYADLDSDEYAGHIWLVDNHQLLQKYTYDGLDASNLKIFSRTERYSGWLCTCPWLYHPLPDVKGILGNMEKVRRSYPG
ncbi:hypothetical protein GCK32_014844 [Trichostrongylus colubriformis]|uniref:Uncharacterized protein n=1 Tax=Trichostrongylus colubriformis TaxID=6319 RepID=A0AAN8GF37_TRICO